ncbi:YdeI/OmpD-associated family protein [Mucilaginibacter myungsuensis]|nr:YdeI/OmpD-associated family protein [Mucilaginibacter myungsuensis]MDN3598086.1 YdeI/OmpD-associated family protein [Mucilaginibacter myungsuensis]
MQPDIETFYPKTRDDWRQWLISNHALAKGVWLLQYKKATGVPTISWSEAVDEALCFGWVDSIRRSVDENSFVQFVGPRKPTSTWSKINKDKVKQLTADGLMHPAGQAVIDIAKKNGSWTILDTVEEIKIPKDLTAAFKGKPAAKRYFTSLSRSVKKRLLHWLITAKRPETRQKRIDELTDLAAQKTLPKQFL